MGVDLGTSGVRAVAVAEDGERLAAVSRPLTSTRQATGGGTRHEQDPEQWWAQAASALDELTAAVGGSASLEALAVSATSGTVVVVDESGRPLTPGVMYDDARGARFTDRVNEVGAEVWARLGYRVQGSWALPTLLDLAAAGALPPGARVLHQPDLVTSRLAGRPVASDSSHALKTGLDLDALAWPADVMAELGVPLEALPPVALPGEVVGRVALPGALDGCAIVAGMTDGCAAQLAAGAAAPGSWNSVLGTTLVVKGSSAQRLADPSGAVYAHRGPFGAGWFPGGASSTGAGALAARLPDRDPSVLAAPEGVPVAYPLEGTGERFPFVHADARAFGVPARADGGDGAVFSAVAHGVACLERLCFDLLDLIGYETGGSLSLTGGGARSAWWNQLRADLLGREVLVPADAEGAVGMALLAAASGDGRLEPATARVLGPATALAPAPRPELLAGYRAFLGELRSRGWLGAELHDHAMGRAS